MNIPTPNSDEKPEFINALDGVELDERLFAKLLQHSTRKDGSLKPEAKVRISWIVKFIREYGYESRQIDIEVPSGRIGRAAESGSDTVYADIVVYRDTNQTEAFIVMETKAPGENKGLRQSESYARNLGAEYHSWHNGEKAAKFFRTERFGQSSHVVGDLPRWVGLKPIIEEIPKTMVLPSFRDENHMRDVVHRCHDHPNLNHEQIQGKIGYFAEHNLFGSDINDRMVRVAKMNMIMHGDGHAGIANINGLSLINDLPSRWVDELGGGQFTIVYSNPPFAGREKDDTVLKQFELGKNKSGHTTSVSKEVLFIEMIIKVLAVGGKAGLVLPAGVFNKLQKSIDERTRVSVPRVIENYEDIKIVRAEFIGNVKF